MEPRSQLPPAGSIFGSPREPPGWPSSPGLAAGPAAAAGMPEPWAARARARRHRRLPAGAGHEIEGLLAAPLQLGAGFALMKSAATHAHAHTHPTRAHAGGRAQHACTHARLARSLHPVHSFGKHGSRCEKGRQRARGGSEGNKGAGGAPPATSARRLQRVFQHPGERLLVETGFWGGGVSAFPPLCLQVGVARGSPHLSPH